MISNEYNYVTGQKNSNYDDVIAEIEVLNHAVIRNKNWLRDVYYGFHRRECFDICYAEGKAKALVIYLHAGYWQSRDKTQFHFIASHIVELGYHVALINYPICPEVSIHDIKNSVSHALFTVKKSIKEDVDLPLYIAGHSAGAHLATEMAIEMNSFVMPQLNLKGIIPISGIYDLEPLVATSLNKNLQLTQTEAVQNSPILRVSSALVAAEFIVGGNETEAFVQQSQNMTNIWSSSNVANLNIIRDHDHFNVLFHFLKEGEIVKALERLYTTTI